MDEVEGLLSHLESESQYLGRTIGRTLQMPRMTASAGTSLSLMTDGSRMDAWKIKLQTVFYNSNK